PPRSTLFPYTTLFRSTKRLETSRRLNMEADAAKLIGAGIACIGMGGAGIGVGIIFGNFLTGALPNPSAAPAQFTNALIGAALAEGLGIFSLVIALLLL